MDNLDLLLDFFAFLYHLNEFADLRGLADDDRQFLFEIRDLNLNGDGVFWMLHRFRKYPR